MNTLATTIPKKKTSRLVVVILGGLVSFMILGSYACNQFTSLIRSATEVQTKGRLSMIRSYVGIYYGDHDKTYPPNLEALIPRYITSFPKAELSKRQGFLGIYVADHPASGSIHYFSSLTPDDRGGWGYVTNPGSTDFGKVFINCTHADLRDRAWSSY